MAAYVGHYINEDAVSRRLSGAVVRRVYDDWNVGLATSEADGDNKPISPLAQLIVDAEAKFEGFCRGSYDLGALRIAKPCEAIRLVLDVAEALAAKRFPRAMNRDWMQLEASVNAELKALRKSETRFDVVGAPEPPTNVGGDIQDGTSGALLDPLEPTYLVDWGSF
jgi:hypothetical protein